MTLLSAVQVADYWIGAGGPKSRAVEWVAIAMGESGLNDDAVSPAGAIGVWQIMPFNAGGHGLAPRDLYNPHFNAMVAVAMSGGGVNCAAWDSAYLDIYKSGRYTFLAYPERGSADYNNLAAAAAELAGHGLKGIASAGSPSPVANLTAAAKEWQEVGNHRIPGVYNVTVRTARSIGSVGKRGWRP